MSAAGRGGSGRAGRGAALRSSCVRRQRQRRRRLAGSAPRDAALSPSPSSRSEPGKAPGPRLPPASLRGAAEPERTRRAVLPPAGRRRQCAAAAAGGGCARARAAPAPLRIPRGAALRGAPPTASGRGRPPCRGEPAALVRGWAGCPRKGGFWCLLSRGRHQAALDSSGLKLLSRFVVLVILKKRLVNVFMSEIERPVFCVQIRFF